jgi:hypothetical protein
MKRPARSDRFVRSFGSARRSDTQWFFLALATFVGACNPPQSSPLRDDAGQNGHNREDTAAAQMLDGARTPRDTSPQTPASIDGAKVSVSLSAEQQAEVDRLKAIHAEATSITPEQLLAKRAVPWKTLTYDATTAQHLDLIQSSPLKLNTAELDVLKRNGFVISDKHRFPHFGYGYKTIYASDLPVFVSADSILQAVHQSYDAILKAIEIDALAPELGRLLDGMRTRLATNPPTDPQARADADLFLAVAKSLLTENVAAPVANGDAGLIRALFDAAKAAQGSKEITLFGIPERRIDFSQFKPRGHYDGNDALERYFRASVWLGRIDFPFLRTDPNNGQQILVRQCMAAAFALRALMDDEAIARWDRIDQAIRAFVGEPDSMGPPDVDRLAKTLGISLGDLASVDDEKLAQAIVQGGYGKQRILSQIVSGPRFDTKSPLPLDATFLFMGQRYVFDSHVLSNVVYDRVPKRLRPNTLDVAYAALANDKALALLTNELKTWEGFAPALEGMRRLGDEHTASFWNANLYNQWQGALRALSPGKDVVDGNGLPLVARTEPWARRVLNTQLASWAQLRHDTILYAKQSYTSAPACEFPDAYVDPYPDFFAKIATYARNGRMIADSLPLTTLTREPITKHFSHLERIAGILREMAELQRQGQPHKPEHLAFINQAVKTHYAGCGGREEDGPNELLGWYGDLFFDLETALKFDPTIADVHTTPDDEGGTEIGEVLHVGTGYARLMVTTFDTCAGPRAYAGLAFSFHEQKTLKYERLTDSEWAKKFTPTTSPEDVTWMRDLITK